jgi:hypothetical protein
MNYKNLLNLKQIFDNKNKNSSHNKFNKFKNFKTFKILISQINIILLFLLLNNSISSISSKLIGVIQINRHGARTGGTEYEKLSSKYYFGSSNKHLTFTGISQHELLGQYIAENYIYNINFNKNILSQEVKNSEIKIISSSKQRCVFSAFGFLKGLYPNSKIKLNFENSNQNSKNLTDLKTNTNKNSNKDYINIDFRDLDLDITPPINNFKIKRNFSEIEINVALPEKDNLFRVKSCKVKTGETKIDQEGDIGLNAENINIYSEESLKDLIKKDNVKFNYTNPLFISQKEINDAVEDLKIKFPIAFDNQSQDKYNEKKEKDKKDNSVNLIYDEKFLKKQNAFIRFALFHFKDKFLKLKKSTITTFNKIQVNKSYELYLSKSAYSKLISSKLFKEIKKYIVEILKGNLQDKENKLKYVLFSGHDFNVLSLLVNFFDRNSLIEAIRNIEINYKYVQPELASHFIIELHRKKTSDELGRLNGQSVSFIKLIYNGEEILSSLDKNIIVNQEYKGIELRNFIRYLDMLIDPSVDDMKCDK